MQADFRMSTFAKQRPLIVVDFDQHNPRLRYLVDLAEKREWKLLWSAYETSRPEQLDGAIVEALPGSPLVERLQSAGFPVVRWGHFRHPADDTLPVVLPDLRATGQLAAEHFVERQYKEVAFVGYVAHVEGQPFYPMYKQFFDASEALGMSCTYHSTRYESIASDTNEDRIRKKAENYVKLISGMSKPVGLFAVTDGIGRSICDACFAAGLQVPEDVAVLGYGDVLACQLMPVQISSIRPAHEREATRAMDLLQDLMNGGSPPPDRIMVPPERIIDRESTDVLASSDPLVRRALRFLWDNLDQDVSVEDVVRATGASHSTLHRKLQEDIGRGIVAELRRKRLERACQLLLNSELTVSDIAKKTGFSTKNYLHRVFHQELGMTPREYRQSNRKNGE